MPVIKTMQDLTKYYGNKVSLANGEEKKSGLLKGLTFVGKTRGSIGKAYLAYSKKNGLEGSKGVDIFSGRTEVEVED